MCVDTGDPIYLIPRCFDFPRQVDTFDPAMEVPPDRLVPSTGYDRQRAEYRYGGVPRSILTLTGSLIYHLPHYEAHHHYRRAVLHHLPR